MRTVLLGLGLLGFCAAVARAGLPVEVTRLDGAAVSGELEALVPQVRLIGPEGSLVLDWAELLSIRPLRDSKASAPPGDARAGEPPAGPSDAAQSAPASAPAFPLTFVLVDDSQFAARIVARSSTGVTVETSAGQRADIEIPALRSISAPAAPEAARRKFSEVVTAQAASDDAAEPAGDVIVVSAGDQLLDLRGVVRSIDDRNVAFEWNGRIREIGWSRIAGLRFAAPAPRTATCMVHVSNGDQFAGRVAEGDSTTIVLQSGVLDRLTFSWNQIERIDCRSDRLVFLSDLTPRRYEFEPFLEKRWDFSVDHTLTGRPIRLGGRGFARGVCMHSAARLTYQIGGQFKQFAASAGIADEMNRRGNVHLSILGDGRVLWEADHVRGGEPPRDVLVELRGVREMTLVVDYGDELDLSDHACWAFARLIR